MQDGSHVVGRQVVLFGLPEQVHVQPSQLLLHPVLLVLCCLSTCQVETGELDPGPPPPISSEITKMQQVTGTGQVKEGVGHQFRIFISVRLLSWKRCSDEDCSHTSLRVLLDLMFNPVNPV